MLEWTWVRRQRPERWRMPQCSGVLGMLLDCAERIEAIDADTTEPHLAIDEVIRNHQARSAL
jgi:hypothetical protein